MVQLLLTRSPEQNSSLAQLINRPDLPTFSLPLLQALPNPETPELRSLVLELDLYDQIIFISRNAVTFGMPLLEQYWPQWPLNLIWLAVGPGTATALNVFSIEPEYPDLASSEGMLAMDVLQEVEGQRVLIVRGVGGRETLRHGLEHRGARVDYLEVYHRQVISYSSRDLPNGPLVAALVYSAEAIEHLYRLVATQATRYMLVVPSKRLQDMAISTGFDKVHVARSQEDREMVEVLNNILGNFA